MAGAQFVRKVALRYLWSKRSEAFITIITIFAIIGVAIGVAVINLVMAIMTGFENELRAKVVGNAHIIVTRIGGKIHDFEKHASMVRSMDGVRSVSAYTQHQALITSGTRSRGVTVLGIQRQSVAAGELRRYLNSDASLEQLFQPPIIEQERDDGGVDQVQLPAMIVGLELQRQLRMPIGEPVRVLSPDISSGPLGPLPRFRRFLVVEAYESGLSGFEEVLTYTSLSAAQSFFRMQDAVSGFEVMVSSIDGAPAIAGKIYEQLNSGRQGGFLVEAWTERNRELWEAIKLEKRVYFIVLLLLIVMASFSIIATLVLIVIEKRRDIAILKTLGATTKNVANIFRYQGAVIGGIGVVLGSIGGYVGAVTLRTYGFPLPKKIFPTDVVPVHLEPLNFLAVAVAAFLICFFATVYPARRAGKVEPAEVLRYE